MNIDEHTCLRALYQLEEDCLGKGDKKDLLSLSHDFSEILGKVNKIRSSDELSDLTASDLSKILTSLWDQAKILAWSDHELNSDLSLHSDATLPSAPGLLEKKHSYNLDQCEFSDAHNHLIDKNGIENKYFRTRVAETTRMLA